MDTRLIAGPIVTAPGVAPLAVAWPPAGQRRSGLLVLWVTTLFYGLEIMLSDIWRPIWGIATGLGIALATIGYALARRLGRGREQ